jgi:hypothetical protein
LTAIGLTPGGSSQLYPERYLMLSFPSHQSLANNLIIPRHNTLAEETALLNEQKNHIKTKEHQLTKFIMHFLAELRNATFLLYGNPVMQLLELLFMYYATDVKKLSAQLRRYSEYVKFVGQNLKIPHRRHVRGC